MPYEILPVTRLEQNCSVIWCESSRKAAVIDPGGDLWRITDLLEWEELTLEWILVTHGHCDHAGGCAELARQTGAAIAGPHRDEAPLLATLDNQGARFGLKGEAFTPDRWLEDGSRVTIGELSLDVLHCPGHTRGHVAYHHAAGKVAFVGDILFRHAIGAWQHPHGSLEDLVRSIRGKLFPLGDDVRFVPGHGPMSSFGHERIENPFVGDRARAAALKARVAAPADHDLE